MKRPRDSQRYLSDKRLHRLEILWRRKRKLAATKPSRLLKSEYKSEILNMLWALQSAKRKEHASKIFEFKVPSSFSVIDAPAEALEHITLLAQAGRVGRKRWIRIDQYQTRNMDLAAESLQAVIIKEIDREATSRDIKFRVSGYLPEDDSLEKFARAMGIIKELGVKHEMLSSKEESSLRIFRRQSKLASSRDAVGALDYKEKTAIDFVHYINDCLGDHGRKLTASARMRLTEYAGEILANAEDHSGMHEWCVFGYLDNESEQHICEIAIFNFGKTIAETFSDLPPASFAFQAIEPYLLRHEHSSWFSQNWQRNDLLTLIALQGHISSKNQSEHDTRGQGTVEMIEFFQRVHQECGSGLAGCAKMAVLSGNTHILFDGTYKMTPDQSGRKIIAFNEYNDLNLRPDGKYVRNLGDCYFPGAVIGIKFSLQPSQTEEVA